MHRPERRHNSTTPIVQHAAAPELPRQPSAHAICTALTYITVYIASSVHTAASVGRITAPWAPCAAQALRSRRRRSQPYPCQPCRAPFRERARPQRVCRAAAPAPWHRLPPAPGLGLGSAPTLAAELPPPPVARPGAGAPPGLGPGPAPASATAPTRPPAEALLGAAPPAGSTGGPPSQIWGLQRQHGWQRQPSVSLQPWRRGPCGRAAPVWPLR